MEERQDLISRQAAIDAFWKLDVEIRPSVIDAIIEMLKQLPSVQPERKKGKWFWDENGMDWGLGAWCCSECGSKPETWWESDKRNNPLRCAGGRFCGNCGADMRGEEENHG